MSVHLKVIIMDTLKFIKYKFLLLYIFILYSCNSNNREFVKSEIRIWDWNNNAIPKKAVLLEYKKNNSKFLMSHPNYFLKIQYDSLNKKKYLLIKFRSNQSKLSLKNDYTIIIDDTIHYKIFNFKTAPKNQGGNIFFKVNGIHISEIGDDNIIQFNQNYR